MNFLLNYKGLVDDVLQKKKQMNQQGDNCLLPLWMQWYSGLVPLFHEYLAWNGNNYVKKVKKRLNMAKRVAEDWASLLMSEKVQVTISDDQDKLDDLLKSNDVRFWVKTNRAVEVGFALGYAGVVVDLSNLTFDATTNELVKNPNTKVSLSYYKANQVVPINIENGEMTEVAFVSQTTNYIQANIHKRDENGVYHILMYRKDIEKNQETIYDFNTLSQEPLFAIIQPNIENNIYVDSEFPISIFANSIDTMQALDNVYDAMDIEFLNGKKRIFVSADMTHFVYKPDGKGNEEAKVVNTFAENDTSVWVVPPDKDGKNMVYAPNDPLRVGDLTAGIYAQLNLLSYQCGLGTGYYRFDKQGVATATQVMSENSDTFRNKKKHELLLEPALRTIVKALIYCNNTFTENDVINENADISIIFDDSIIEDKATEQKTDQANLANGTMSLVEYRMKYFGEDEDTAKEKIYAINGRVGLSKRLEKFFPIYERGGMPPKMFVFLAFTDDDLESCDMTREEVIEFFENTKQGDISVNDILGIGGYQPTNEEKEDNKTEENPTDKKEEAPKDQEE